MEPLEEFDGRDQTATIRQQLFESRTRQLIPIKAKFIKARDAYEAKLKFLFPQGAFICWMHNSKSEQCGHVLMHGHYGRIRVRNKNTKNDTWIEAYQVIQFLTKGKP